MYYGTDDAQITSPIVNVSALAADLLATLSVKQGDSVTSGQTIATVTTVSANEKGTANTVDVTSPINGTILLTSVVPGQTVAPGLPLLEVTDLGAETVTAYVDEGAIRNVSVGQDVDILSPWMLFWLIFRARARLMLTGCWVILPLLAMIRLPRWKK